VLARNTQEYCNKKTRNAQYVLVEAFDRLYIRVLAVTDDHFIRGSEYSCVATLFGYLPANSRESFSDVERQARSTRRL
jgi:hypothetical protein